MIQEADIDQKLFDLEDVKQSINEILHKRMYNNENEPELTSKI